MIKKIVGFVMISIPIIMLAMIVIRSIGMDGLPGFLIPFMMGMSVAIGVQLHNWKD